MDKDTIFRERACSISFVEVKVIPSQSERFYQLIRDGSPTRFVYSESHLLECLEALEIKFGL